VVWTAVFGGRVASSFRSPGRSHKYISGGAHVPLGVNSTRTVLNPWHTCKRRNTSAGWGEAEPIAVHTCSDEGHEPGSKPAMPAPTGFFIAEIIFRRHFDNCFYTQSVTEDAVQTACKSTTDYKLFTYKYDTLAELTDDL
jgi:hypothetical protein